ncbi:Protein GrpE [Burkholderiales bacterium]|nr:Protein GrpE [Burkholderiales bacterium]
MAAGQSEGTSGDILPQEQAAPGDVAVAGASVDPLEELRAALRVAEARAGENHDLYLRARAEAENARRRAQDDIAKAHKYAIESFAEALVPVVDSLEKALQDESSSAGALREGVQITLRQLRSAFERGRLTEINPVGEKFDPHRHQAISAVPGDGTVAPNHVVAVLQKGWMISDRVLRPALVTVVQGS